jgi:AAA15 family ATPase/GTPase
MEDSTFATDGLIRRSMNKLFNKENDKIKEKIQDRLSEYDIGFSGFFKQEYDSPVPSKGKIVFYGLNHKFIDKEFTILIDQESSGTKRLIVILHNIIEALLVKSGGVAVIDEIDAFLHPDIVEALVDLFIYPETNPNKAQLLFSTHNHRLLESFDKQQIILTEKNNHGKTESWRLDEMEGVRSTDNFYTKYISGAYGARPKIGE